jgi:hypothetical protein
MLHVFDVFFGLRQVDDAAAALEAVLPALPKGVALGLRRMVANVLQLIHFIPDSRINIFGASLSEATVQPNPR